MNRATLSATTHTVALAQLTELNEQLINHPRAPRLTADELQLAGAAILSHPTAGGLPGSAVLARLCWDGPPEFPYVHAHFGTHPGQADAPQIVDLHTGALQQISHRLGLRQSWG